MLGIIFFFQNLFVSLFFATYVLFNCCEKKNVHSLVFLSIQPFQVFSRSFFKKKRFSLKRKSKNKKKTKRKKSVKKETSDDTVEQVFESKVIQKEREIALGATRKKVEYYTMEDVKSDWDSSKVIIFTYIKFFLG